MVRRYREARPANRVESLMLVSEMTVYHLLAEPPSVRARCGPRGRDVHHVLETRYAEAG